MRIQITSEQDNVTVEVSIEVHEPDVQTTEVINMNDDVVGIFEEGRQRRSDRHRRMLLNAAEAAHRAAGFEGAF